MRLPLRGVEGLAFMDSILEGLSRNSLGFVRVDNLVHLLNLGLWPTRVDTIAK